jgi:hypothetical protein
MAYVLARRWQPFMRAEVRSPIKERLNSATAPMTWKINRPPGG